MTAGRRVFVDAEPCTIDARVVAELLEHVGWPNAADFVQRLGRDAQAGNVESMRWREAYTAVLDRLHRLEPPAPEPERTSCKPDWTCDG